MLKRCLKDMRIVIKIVHCKDSPLILKQKEIFNELVNDNELVNERLDEVTELDKKVNPDYLIYKYKGPTADVKFNKFDNALSLTDKIRKGEISLADAKNNQIKFKSDLSEKKKGNKKKIKGPRRRFV